MQKDSSKCREGYVERWLKVQKNVCIKMAKSVEKGMQKDN